MNTNFAYPNNQLLHASLNSESSLLSHILPAKSIAVFNRKVSMSSQFIRNTLESQWIKPYFMQKKGSNSLHYHQINTAD